ncbi:type II toxin-antitoxin system RelE/ParE family toxin [Roseofilum casamattae]|uniref:Type II toxin-antitoxin system RelE/ParE family toxin n=1 Tax=Roseofilum casamattae BLCC-M143 TaxID=3022442 RepID=A0ABT7BZT3_9CYAN|nr:type II toxin-antitoxin system RelE/ParE family toxin [Roseofilum casamattae]MDJ1184705.1 type II toxin-antitoxin system RelE/ParE family toxin [Roseofilum casamattae BLCC-M143]
MEFQVQISKSAEIEIERAYEWLKERNPSYSDRWFRELMDKLATLQAQPRRCALAIENDAFSEDVRQLLYGKPPQVYRILFVIRNDIVYVIHVRHSKQAPLTAPDPDEEEE